MRRTIICAEIGANHLQDYDRAVQLVKDAHWAGADMVKVQMYTPDSLTIDSQDERFQIKEGPWAGQTLYELYTKTCMPYEWVPKLKKLAEDLGLLFMTSVYDTDTVDIAEGMGIEWYKIASFEINHHKLIERVNLTKKPTVISLGCAIYDEYFKSIHMIERKYRWILHCVSTYPAHLKDCYLQRLSDINSFGNIGLSDHTTTTLVPSLAVALGAKMIEKHIGVGDSKDVDFFALPRAKFKHMVDKIRRTESCFKAKWFIPTDKYKRKLIDGKLVRTVC